MTYMPRDQRHEQIVNAAMDLVTKEGLAAATVRRIAQELGCSPGQIHHHFASADALRAEAVREVWRRIEPDYRAFLHRLPPRPRLIAILSDCSEQLKESPNPFMAAADRLWNEAWDTRSDPVVRQAIIEAIADIRAEVVLTLQEGVDAGAFPAGINVAKLSLVLMAASQGYDVLGEICPLQDLGQTKADYIDEVLRNNGILPG